MLTYVVWEFSRYWTGFALLSKDKKQKARVYIPEAAGEKR